MYVKLGNVAVKEGFRETVNEADFTVDELRAQADDAGIDSAGMKKNQIAAALGNQVHFRPVEYDGADGAVTDVHFPDEMSLAEAFSVITSPRGVWANHSDEPPAWVESDNDSLAQILADHYGCDIGRSGTFVETAVEGDDAEGDSE